MPEKGHALDQGLVGCHHLLDPPVLELAALLLDRPDDTEVPAVDALLALGFGRLLETLHLGRPEADPFRCRRHCISTYVGEETVDRRRIVDRFEGTDFGRRHAEGGAGQEVPRLVEPHRRRRACGRGRPKSGGETGRQRRSASHETATTKACAHDRPPIAADAVGLRPADDTEAEAAAAARHGRRGASADVRAGRPAGSAQAGSTCAASPSAARHATD